MRAGRVKRRRNRGLVAGVLALAVTTAAIGLATAVAGSGGTTLVSRASGGEKGDGPSSFPSVSEDGRYVAFRSESRNLHPDDTDGRKTKIMAWIHATILAIGTGTGIWFYTDGVIGQSLMFRIEALP